MSQSYQRTYNVLERYHRDFNNLFDSPNQDLFVFFKRVREEAIQWEKRHEDAVKGSFTNRKGGKEVPWPGKTLRHGNQRKKGKMGPSDIGEGYQRVRYSLFMLDSIVVPSQFWHWTCACVQCRHWMKSSLLGQSDLTGCPVLLLDTKFLPPQSQF